MAEATKKDKDENSFIAAIGYVGILCFVPLIAKKNSPYAQFHAKQSMQLFIVEAVLIFLALMPVLNILLAPVIFLGWLVCLVAALYGFINAVQGKEKELPFFRIIGKYLNI